MSGVETEKADGTWRLSNTLASALTASCSRFRNSNTSICKVQVTGCTQRRHGKRYLTEISGRSFRFANNHGSGGSMHMRPSSRRVLRSSGANSLLRAKHESRTCLYLGRSYRTALVLPKATSSSFQILSGHSKPQCSFFGAKWHTFRLSIAKKRKHLGGGFSACVAREVMRYSHHSKRMSTFPRRTWINSRRYSRSRKQRLQHRRQIRTPCSPMSM